MHSHSTNRYFGENPMKLVQPDQSHFVRALLSCLIIIVGFNLLGCSAAIRTERNRLQTAEYQKQGSWRTLLCGKDQVQVKHQISSRSTLLGVIVPVIPVQIGSTGDFLVQASTLSMCPNIEQSGSRFKGTKSPSGDACRYNGKKLQLGTEMTISAETAAGRCTTKPFSYKKDVDWDYALMVTA